MFLSRLDCPLDSMCHTQGWSQSPGRRGGERAGMGVSDAGILRETETGTQRKEILQEARSQRGTNAGQVRPPAQASPSV